MKVWRIKLRKTTDKVDVKKLILVPEGFSPTRGRGLKSLDRVRSSPPRTWPVTALFGLYVEQYEKRYRRQWGFTAVGGSNILDDLVEVVKRVGMAEAVSAVNAVFEMKWVNRDHIEFLTNVDKYARFIVPELDKKRQRKGEQSEWSGGREFESGKVDAEAFFYGKGGK